MLICEKTQKKILKNPDKALIGLIFRLTQSTVPTLIAMLVWDV